MLLAWAAPKKTKGAARVGNGRWQSMRFVMLCACPVPMLVIIGKGRPLGLARKNACRPFYAVDFSSIRPRDGNLMALRGHFERRR